jgi:hypothetical protein
LGNAAHDYKQRGAERRYRCAPFSPSQVSPHLEGEDQQGNDEIAARLGGTDEGLSRRIPIAEGASDSITRGEGPCVMQPVAKDCAIDIHTCLGEVIDPFQRFEYLPL